MRVGHLQPTRPEWYDRNPQVVGMRSVPTLVGAVGLTTGAVFTVPTGQKAYLDMVLLAGFRTIAATPPAYIYADGIATATSGTVQAAVLQSDVSTHGTVGDQWFGQCGILLAGLVFTLRYLSTFVNGSVDLTLSAKLTIFDA